MLKSWYDVSEETVRSAYRASASTYQPFRQRDAAKFANFIIGDEECDESRKMTEPVIFSIILYPSRHDFSASTIL